MKTFTFCIVLLMTGMLSFSAYSQTRISPGLVFGSEIEKLGITVGAEHFVSPKVSIAPDFIFYLPNKESQAIGGTEIEAKATLWELNGNVHYYFVDNSKISFYGLGGLNYSHVSAKLTQTIIDSGVVESEFKDSDGEIGVNLGAGANFPIGKSFSPFAEVKYVAASTDQLVIGGGLRFDIQ